MKKITVVTGNPNKLREIQSIAPNNIELIAKQLDLPEIQSLDTRQIIEDKVKRAYKVVCSPLIVEDVSAGLDDLGGLPGPFYKFFREKLGDKILVELAKISSSKVTIKCTAAYYDGQQLIISEGVIEGNIVEPVGNNGFGFDPVVVPKGYNQTMAQMTSKEKNNISHRGRAFKDLFTQLAKDDK